MKTILGLFLAAPVPAWGTSSPIAKVITMISDLEAKIIREGEATQKEFAQFSEWCEDRNRNLDFEIKTGNSQVEELKASIAEEGSVISSLSSKIEELAAELATNEADLQAATKIRDHEAGDFAAEEKELVDTIDILQRAIRIIEREMRGGASMIQLKHASNVAQALAVLVQASMIGTSEASKLTAFVQSAGRQSDQQEDAAEEFGAPAGEVYQSHSSNILDTLQDLLDKAESQLDDLRKRETTENHNFQMLRQSLEDEIAVGKKDMAEAKKSSSGSAERRSTAEGDLKATSKELAADIDVKANLHQTCMTRAQAFQAETQSRGEELKTLAEAKKVIQEATSTADSFLQVARLSTSEGLANFAAVRLVRDLARKQNSQALAQLAARMASAMRSGSADPFSKVKGLIVDMISKLEAEAGQDATKKAYCDKELRETKAKKSEKTEEIEKLTTRIDQAAAKSAKLKEEVATLENELSKLASSQAKMDQLRREENEAFVANRAEQEKGLAGIKSALQILREYYSSDAAHNAATGAASGIIGLLETVESDMTKTIAALLTEEEASAAAHDRMTKENEIERTAKEQDVEYRSREAQRLDKTTSENSADRSAVQAELDAILEYLSKIEGECIAKAESYSERVSRREAEIAGLKQALDVLENETALIQRLKGRRMLRGVLRAAHK